MHPSHYLLVAGIAAEVYAAAAGGVLASVVWLAAITALWMLGQCQLAARGTRRELLFTVHQGRDVEVRYSESTERVGVAAYLSGTGTILVTRLWYQLDEEHRWAVLAHELGHAKDRLGVGMYITMEALWWGLPFGFVVALLTGSSWNVAMTVTVMLLPLLRLLRHAVERGCEHDADQHAKEMGYGRQLAAVLRMHKEVCRPAGRTLIERLRASHPPLASRTRRILA